MSPLQNLYSENTGGHEYLIELGETIAWGLKDQNQTAKVVLILQSLSTGKPFNNSSISTLDGIDQHSHAFGTIQSLTGLRFLVVLCIVFNHGKAFFSCWQDLGCSLNLSQAVSFFFVLSGFVLALQTVNFRTRIDIGRFYLRRVTKIWPAHIFCLILLLLLIPEAFKVKVETIPIFLSNLFLVHAWIPMTQVFFSYNAPSWSTSTMMFFYLCFPFIIGLARNRWHILLACSALFVLAAMCICTALELPVFDLHRASIKGLLYINPLTRMFEFVVGVLAAILFRRYAGMFNWSKLTVTSVELILLAAIFTISANSKSWSLIAAPSNQAISFWLFNSGFIVIPFALLIGALSLQKGLVAQCLRFPLVLTLGECSFAIYMFHSVLLTHRSIRYPQDHSFYASVFYLTLLLLVGHLFTITVESSLRNIVSSLHDSKAQNWLVLSSFSKKILPFALGECAVIVCILSLGFPKVQTLSLQESAKYAHGAVVRNVDFLPELRCISALAVNEGSNVVLKMVWQALYDTNLDAVNSVKLIDWTGKELNRIVYQHDSSKRSVIEDEVWLDQVAIPLPSGACPAKVELCLTIPRYQESFTFDQLVIPVTNSSEKE